MIQKQPPEVFYKKDDLKNFAKFTGKHLCRLAKPQASDHATTGLRPATLLKKRLAQIFSCDFCEIFKNTFFNRTPPMAASDDRYLIGS